MKVRMQLADRSGCGNYRGMYPMDALAGEIDGEYTEMMDTQKLFDRNTGRLIREVPRNVECDVIVLQRPCEPRHLAMIPELQKICAVVIDVDDDLTCLHHAHPAWKLFHPNISPEVKAKMFPQSSSEGTWHHLRKACAIADLVTVSTPALAQRYASHGRYAVLRNCVPKRLLDLPHLGDGRTIGWAGLAATHPGDLPVTRGGVAAAVDWTGSRFFNVGNAESVKEQLGLREEPESSGPLPDINDWHHEIGRLDVGIVPLGSTRFNESKSWLKGIEYAARGVPFVASPLPEYQLLAAEGVGFLAQDKARKWRSTLTRLITDDALRAEMALAGREVVAERHTYETQSYRWAEAYEMAIKNHRQHSSRGLKVAA